MPTRRNISGWWWVRFASSALVLATLVACGDDGTTFVDEDPPTGGGGEGGFDPGPSPNGTTSGAGYGYGANSGTSTTAASTSGGTADVASSSGAGGEPPPECDDADKRCAHLFIYENSAASSVEVRGDFAPGAWDAGVPMEPSGSTWSAEVPLPWGQDVEYKFFVDGSQYFTDPANPETVDDGLGGRNSLLDALTCPDAYTCVEE